MEPRDTGAPLFNSFHFSVECRWHTEFMSKSESADKKTAKETNSNPSAEFVKRVEDLARETAGTASRIASSGARGAVNAKKWLDEKWDAGADSLYEANRAIAIDNFARLRKDFPSLSPNASRLKLAEELRGFAGAGSQDAESILAAIRLYVLTAIEVQGVQFKSERAKRRLIVKAIMSTSAPVVFAAKYGPLLYELVKLVIAALAKQSPAKVKTVPNTPAKPKAGKVKIAAKAVAPKLAEKAIKQSGLLDFGLQLIVGHTQRSLGPAPAKWPAAKPAAKAAPKPKPKAKPAS